MSEGGDREGGVEGLARDLHELQNQLSVIRLSAGFALKSAASDETLAKDDPFWSVRRLIENGYASATFHTSDIDPDVGLSVGNRHRGCVGTEVGELIGSLDKPDGLVDSDLVVN